ncbi:MAG: MEKHLA domain-containing protein [Gallionella sp.]|nr:MEKHLA domain-containing protein [Gallionella sp.]
MRVEVQEDRQASTPTLTLPLQGGGDSAQDAALRHALWQAPRAIVAHGAEDDPVFFYGNRLALELFEMSFEDFTQLPSRYSAEPLERDTRARLLERVTRRGYVDDYSGVRIAASGKRFMIEAATVWNLIDEAGNHRGQAATFSDWRALEY